MTDDVRDVSLSEQFPPDSIGYINARLMEIEQEFQSAPDELDVARNEVLVAKHALRSAVAQATIKATGRSADIRAAEVDVATFAERERVDVAEAAFAYLRDVVHELGREKDALQTRSANLRAEMQLGAR